ncbi:MAG: helix-turn-helix transcriptional regulator [Flavisolibacter sp.]|nr:helix-turn-helix transcriptional regulator [Flavisolibacter sp.]
MKVMQRGGYFGKTIESKEINNLILSESIYHQHSKIPLHSHENFYLCLVVKGEYSETYLKENIICTAGDVIVHPNYAEHSNLFHSQTGICFNIEVPDLADKGIAAAQLPHKKLGHSAIVTNVQKVYKEFKAQDQFSSLIIEGLILETVGYFSRDAGSIGPYWLKRAKAIVAEHSMANITLSDIAHRLHVTPAHLAREFKKATGFTIGEYIQNSRVHKACELLKRKMSDIFTVAMECGFNDHSHFTRTFKKVMKVTPSQYKRMIE